MTANLHMELTPYRVIETIRLVDAPITTVFKAWTDPGSLSRWWGPKDFTNTFHQFDPRPGGVWKFTMHGPDNDHYLNESVFLEIKAPSLITWNHLSGPVFQAVVFFVAKENKTWITFHMIFDDAVSCQKVKAFAGPKNEENFDRLEAELERIKLLEKSAREN